LVDNLDFYSQSITFEAKLNGDNLIDILEKSTFSVLLKKGFLQLHNSADNADPRHQKIVFNSAKLQSLPKEPVGLNFTGDVDGTSMEVALTTNTLSDLFRADNNIDLEINAEIAQSNIHLKGDIAPPIKQKNFNMDILISGEKLSHWNELITLHLPSYGPYTLKGNIKSTVDGIALNKVKFNIGNSDLSGEILIKTQNEITHWDIRLNSEKIQILDFLKKDIKLSPHTETPPDEDAESQRNETETKIAETNTTVTKDEAIQREVRNTDASQVTGKITLKAKEVLAGEDKLGYGELTIQFTDTIFSVDHFKLDTPGGSIKGAFALKNDNDEISGDFKLDVDKFDYGHIGKLIQAGPSNDGLISVRANLQLKGKDTHTLLDQANGFIDFVVWPNNIKADPLDIWSANLFFALVPVLEKKESTLNCATALLNIKDGVLTEELIFIDTTKLWMSGNVNINYPEKKVDLVLFPAAKKRKMFGLQLPIRLEGNFADIRVAVKPFDLVEATLSFVTSPLHGLFQHKFTAMADENLSQLCGDLLDREFLKALQKDLNKNVPTLDEMYE